MQLMRGFTGGAIVLGIAVLVGGCIASYPGALPQIFPTPAAQVDRVSVVGDALRAEDDARRDTTPQPMMQGNSIRASWQGAGIIEPPPINVRHVRILRQSGLFQNPGDEIPMGWTETGQEYPVLSVSLDSQWWEVGCAINDHRCWITANPVFVQPVEGLPLTAQTTPQLVCVTATPQPQPTPTAQTLNFANGTAQATGTAAIGAPQTYVFFGVQGQDVRVVLASQPGGANFEVRGANNVVFKSFTDPSLDWTFALPASQEYIITVMATAPTSFVLQVSLQEMARPVERLSFAPGQSTQVVNGNLQADVFKHYIVSVIAGNNLRLALTSTPDGVANFAVNGVADAVVYKSITDPLREVTIAAPVTQDYVITLYSPVAAAYRLEVTIQMPVPPTATPTRPVQSIPSQRELELCCRNQEGPLGLKWCCNLLNSR